MTPPVCGLQDADVYLLDDVLAAVDPSVASWLLEHAIRGQMMQGRTRVLCTHSPTALEYADANCHMRHGSHAGWKTMQREDGPFDEAGPGSVSSSGLDLKRLPSQLQVDAARCGP